ncbi:MAG: Hsp33 family molecular chaperone HslO [Oscillospiraceae bacterium]|nr:Hsp33 family molecular chaperone HslO [Oscillospiraceae bacterium]
MRTSSILRAITRDGSALIVAADTAAVTQRACELHGLSKTMTAVLGRCLTAASLMGSGLKSENDTLTLQFKGDGPAGTVCCVSDSAGNVRGYADNPSAELPPNQQGKLDVGGAIGQGMMYVLKDLGLSEPYCGVSEIVTGEIAEDVTAYFVKSEQTPSVCALGVLVNRDLSCRASGGFLIQLLPFPDEATVTKIEENVGRIELVSALFDGEAPLEEIAARVLDGIPLDILDEAPIEYRCNCSRERYGQALASLGREELERLISGGEPVETKCSFCNSAYVFEAAEIEGLIV